MLLLSVVVMLRPRRRLRPPPPQGTAPTQVSMTRAEALAVLGLKEGATRVDITREYKRLMLKVHPDHGGSEYLAAKLNEARDLLARKS